MASLQTRMAQAAARDADSEWKRHLIDCAICYRSTRERDEFPCNRGRKLRETAIGLRQVAREESAADRAPMPRQEALFSEEEAGGC